MTHPQIFARAFNTPLLIDASKAQAFVSGFGSRLLGAAPEFVGGVDQVPASAYRTAKPFASLLDQSLTESLRRGDRQGYAVRDGVAVIPVTGVLVHRGAYIGQSSGQTSYEGLTASIEAAAEAPNVRAIALEIDSFGGEVSGCFGLAQLIGEVAAQMPVRAFVAEHAYSAAYAIASQADRVILPATGGVGSVGVICMHADYSQALDDSGIRVTLIHAGEHKADGNPYAPLPDDVRDGIQAEMETLRGIFAETVGRGRGSRLTADAALTTEAQCFMGEAAVAAGLADAVAEPRAAFEAFVAEVNQTGTAGPSRFRLQTPTERTPEMTTPVQPTSAASSTPAGTTAAPSAAAPSAAATPPASEAPASAPVASAPEASTPPAEAPQAAAGERTRIAGILNAPEAAGRSDLAKHLAFETDLTVEAAIGILGASAKSGGTLASEMQGYDTSLDSPSAEGAPGPRAVDAVKKRHG